MTLYNENGYAIPDQMDAFKGKLDSLADREMFQRYISEPLSQFAESLTPKPVIYDERGRQMNLPSNGPIGKTFNVPRPRRFMCGETEVRCP